MKVMVLYTRIFSIFFIFLLIPLKDVKAQWETDVRLTNDTAQSLLHGRNHSMAVNGCSLYITWYDYRDGNAEIYYKRSSDNGATWSSDMRLTNNSGISQQPSICVTGVVVHIVWSDYRNGDYEIYYLRSTNNGINWETESRLTNSGGVSNDPSISASGTIIHVAWVDSRGGNQQVYYKRSSNEGNVWSAETLLTNFGQPAASPSIVNLNSTVHLVYHTGGYMQSSSIYYKRSSNSGLSWGYAIDVSSNNGSQWESSFAVLNDSLHIVYQNRNGSGPINIYYIRSTNGGTNWSASTLLSNPNSSYFQPSISYKGLYIHVTWWTTNVIFYTRSENNGNSWLSDTILVGQNGCGPPTISESGTILHLLWYDSRSGNSEIYYKRNLTGNPNGILQIGSAIPYDFKLNQNYPNPFNPQTNIKFDIPNRSNLKISVFDILGKEISVLVNEELNPGTFEVNWDAANYPSGVYFYKIVTENFSESKKMVLIK